MTLDINKLAQLATGRILVVKTTPQDETADPYGVQVKCIVLDVLKDLLIAHTALHAATQREHDVELERRTLEHVATLINERVQNDLENDHPRRIEGVMDAVDFIHYHADRLAPVAPVQELSA